MTRLLSRLMLFLVLAMPSRAFAAQPCMDPNHLGPEHYMQPRQVDLIDLLGRHRHRGRRWAR
jgi:hypothetical protein